MSSRAARIEPLEGRIAPATFVWDGGGGDSAWENALNWDLDSGFPIGADDVVLNIASTIDTSGATRFVRSFTQSDGVLTGNGALLMDSFVWTGGTQSGSGPTLPSGNAMISGPAVKTLDGRSLTAQGSSRMELSGAVSLVNSAVFATFGHAEISATLVMSGAAGTSFDLLGTLDKSTAAPATFALDVNNHGDIFARAGTIEFGGGFLQSAMTGRPHPSLTLDGGDVTFSGGAPAQFLDGSIRGYGMITGDVQNNGATIVPGGQTPGGLAPASTNLTALEGTLGFRTRGGADQDYAGRSVSAAGDVNGDGFGDVIIGAYRAGDEGGGDRGNAYVIFGKNRGFSPDLDLAALNGTDGFKLVGEVGDLAGLSVAAAGDVNGDGFADVIVGAHAAASGGASRGAAYVVFGKAGAFAPSVALPSLDGTDGFRLVGATDSESAGYSVSGAGDVNGDGFADVIVGAVGADAGGTDRGAVYVFFGKASGFAASVALGSLNGVGGFRLSGADDGDYAGNAVAAAGDVNGDGFADVIIGASGVDDAGINCGAAYVVFGKASGFANLSLGVLNGTDGFRLVGAADGDRAGFAVSSAGDFNGDGFGDVIVGAPYADGGLSDLGYSYVVLGDPGPFAADVPLDGLSGTDGFFIRGAFDGGRQGSSVAAAGDVNGDGFGDVIVGAPRAGEGGVNRGAAYVVFGYDPAAMFNNTFLSGLDGTDGFKLSGGQNFGEAGRAVAGAGDVNADGLDDVLVGVPSASGGGIARGVVSVVFGSNGIGGLAITGDYEQSANARLAAEVGGAANGEFDLLLVGGQADLAGVVRGTLFGAFAPGAGASFTFLNATALGGFANEDLQQPLTLSLLATQARFVVAGGGNPLEVTTTADVIDGGDGVTSLREAILFANSNGGGDTITFNIPGGGVQTIALTSALPAITEAVLLDGNSQPGASVNTLDVGDDAVLLIVLDGVNAGTGVDGLTIQSNGATIRGLVVVRFDGAGIVVNGTGAVAIEGNFIGLGADGTTAMGNGGAGVKISGGSFNRIGGLAQLRNLISANGAQGIEVFGASVSNTTIESNYIGTDRTGMLDRGNTFSGIVVAAANTNIGEIGTLPNVISGNGGNGIQTANPANNTVIKVNFIGVGADGVTPLGNDGPGIGLGSNVATSTIIGGTDGANVIAYNGGSAGVRVAAGTGALIRFNSIFANAGLGIDLGPAGVTPNDALDADTGVNELLNFPEFTAARETAGTVVRGTYRGAMNATFSLDFYRDATADASGFGEGRVFAGSVEVTTDANGEADFEFLLTTGTGGLSITGTATNSTGSTSEFSAAALALPVTLARNESSVTFTDIDGDVVIIKVTKGKLQLSDFVAQEIDGRLFVAKIDLTTRAALFEGASVTISAKTPRGGAGNGRVDVEEIDATGINLAKLSIDGNVDIIRVGSGTAGKLALKTLSAYSIGLDSNSDAQLRSGPRVAGGIVLADGGIGSMRVATDVSATFTLTGSGAGIRNTKIGGGITASSFTVPAKMDVIKVLRDITETSFRVGNSIDRLAVTGDIERATVRIGGTLKSLSVGGDVIDSDVFAPGPVPGAKTKRITAIGSVTVKGDFIRSELRAGYDENAAATGDAGIGSVTVRGNFEASSIVAGAAAGADGFFGTDDDGVIAGGSAAIVARIASITIKGAVLGTAGDAGDAFGFVAEELGKIKVGTTSLVLTKGAGNDLARFTLPGADDVFAREVAP